MWAKVMFQRNQFQRPQYERLCNQAKYIVLLYSIFGTKREAYKLPKSRAEGEGVENTLSLGNSTTAGPIAFKFGVCLATS